MIGPHSDKDKHAQLFSPHTPPGGMTQPVKYPIHESLITSSTCFQVGVGTLARPQAGLTERGQARKASFTMMLQKR